MNELDKALREALERKAPPEGFAERVMQRLGESPDGILAAGPQPVPRPEAAKRWARRLAPAMAAVVLLGIWGGHEIAERRRGQQAKEQLMVALQIASAKANLARTEAVRAMSDER